MVQIHNQDRRNRSADLQHQVQTIKDSLKAAYESSLAREEATKERVDGLKTGGSRSTETQHTIQYLEA